MKSSTYARKPQFAVGTLWVFEERVVQVDGPLSLQVVQVRDVASGELKPAPVHHLTLPSNAAQKAADPLTVPQNEWDRALTLARAFQPYVECRALPTRVTQAIALRHAITFRQVQRLRAQFQATHQTTALVRGKGGRPVGLRCLIQEVERLIQHVIAKHYACREPATKECIVERVRLICSRLSYPRPSRKTILARISEAQGYAMDRARHGAKSAKQVWEARPGMHQMSRPLEEVQIDHTLVDVLVVHEDGTVAGRPWLTLAIDVATRVVLGWYLTMDAPSSISVAMCLAHAMLPKPETQDDPELWPMYGKPLCVLLDNGKDFRSYALKRGCEQHGIELKWRPVRVPHYGAHIERLIGTFMTMVHSLPGTTFSNVKARGDYPSERRACLTLEDLRAWFVQKICRGYHVRTHRSLGVPPLIAWERAFRQPDGTLRMPEVPLRPDDLRRDFYPFVFRRIQRTGVQLGQSRYWASALAPLVHPQRQVRVHYNKQNPSCVWIRADGDVLVEAVVVAGAALSHGRAVALTDQEQAYLDQKLLDGYETADAVEASARGRQRIKQSHGSGQGTARKSRPAARSDRKGDAARENQLALPALNRASVTFEVLEP
jgi:putative transposase